MRVIPAIDLKDGKCVRLFQGDFDRCTEYNDDPPLLAAKYQAMGFTELHIVDLDGAQSGQQLNRATIAAMAAESQLTIQLGGGIRDTGTVDAWLDAGVSRCVIGSCAVTEPALVREWFNEFGPNEFGPERIMLALDVRFAGKSPRLATHGWTADNDVTLWQCLEDYQAFGLQHVLCTDVCRDGAMSGPCMQMSSTAFRQSTCRPPAAYGTWRISINCRRSAPTQR
jgi:phosphoribosylformimino-5-aminoimidazole carboxamide ribotide isomerase